MQLNKLAITLLVATTTVAARMERRDAAELVKRFDSDAEVAKRAPILDERQGGNGGDSGGNCGSDGNQNFGYGMACNKK